MATPAARSAGRPTRAEAARLDDSIRSAAIAAFIARGFDGVTMEDVARAAGVGKPALYARYRDKAELFTAVVPWALQNLKWELTDVPVGVDARTALVAIARATIERAIDPEMVGLFRMAMAESPRFPEVALTADEVTRSPLLAPVREVLERHRAAGEIDVVDVELAAEHFIGMVHLTPLTFAAFGFERDPADRERFLERTVDLFLDGARSRSDAGSQPGARVKRITPSSTGASANSRRSRR